MRLLLDFMSHALLGCMPVGFIARVNVNGCSLLIVLLFVGLALPVKAALILMCAFISIGQCFAPVIAISAVLP